MINPPRTFEVINDYEGLNQSLMGVIALLKRGEISTERADSISKAGAVIVKNNITAVLNLKRKGDTDSDLKFFTQRPTINITNSSE